MVKELREKTGCGLMDCKNALGDAGGDVTKAVTVLREKGIAKASAKAGRKTAEGIIAYYIHPGDKLGVMIEINCETDFVARTDNFKSFARNIAMHVAAVSPAAVTREEIASEVLEAERSIYRQQALNEGKPEKIVEKIVEGKVEKFIAESVLLEQPFVKNNDLTVGDYVKEMISTLGENIIVRRFSRFRLGE